MFKGKLSIFFLLLSLISIVTVNAQTKFDVPQNVDLKSKDDYANYESAIINAAKWLEETDLNQEPAKRQQVNAFVLQWISGSPTIVVSINEQLGKIYGKNVQLLGIYLASYARNFLENGKSATPLSATRAGLVSMINVYKKGIGIIKSKEMENVIKLAENNQLDDYINEEFK